MSFRLILYILSIQLILSSILYQRHSLNTALHGVICLYLLLGLTWAIAYSTLDHFLDSAFTGIDSNSDYMYFSFVTLTSLGYGDIRPVHPSIRMLAALEAISGILFTAIIVARLVGSFGQQEPSKAK